MFISMPFQSNETEVISFLDPANPRLFGYAHAIGTKAFLGLISDN